MADLLVDTIPLLCTAVKVAALVSSGAAGMATHATMAVLAPLRQTPDESRRRVRLPTLSLSPK
jgi:hypothetical protein